LGKWRNTIIVAKHTIRARKSRRNIRLAKCIRGSNWRGCGRRQSAEIFRFHKCSGCVVSVGSEWGEQKNQVALTCYTHILFEVFQRFIKIRAKANTFPRAKTLPREKNILRVRTFVYWITNWYSIIYAQMQPIFARKTPLKPCRTVGTLEKISPHLCLIKTNEQHEIKTRFTHIPKWSAFCLRLVFSGLGGGFGPDHQPFLAKKKLEYRPSQNTLQPAGCSLAPNVIKHSIQAALSRQTMFCPSHPNGDSGKSTTEYGRGRRKANRVGKNTLFFDYEKN
jgi:hypothetical protein